MSHSRIYQISSKRIAKDDYASPSDFYNNSSDFADYIGDEIYDEDDRKEDIKHLADVLSDLFDLSDDGNALVYKGKEAMKKFQQEWADAIRQAAQEITAENVLESSPRWKIRSISEETHLQTSRRVSIEGWNTCASPMDELIEWVAYRKFKAGKKIYVGAVIDYHY
jgi:hypothetical protein